MTTHVPERVPLRKTDSPLSELLAASTSDAGDALNFADLRRREFARLDAAGETYLDYTGSAQYAESHVRSHASLLVESLLGNPHSESPASRRGTAHLDKAGELTLQFLDADSDEYGVILTPNATGAVRLVAESFPFVARSRLVLSADNHNSVNGIREYAVRRGAEVQYVGLDGGLQLCDPLTALADNRRRAPSLFAYPAQSNFSGVQHPLGLVEAARQLGYRVLLDAAAFVPTNPLSLRHVWADVVALSFYKIFGYPTGLGALVARHEALAELSRPWFAAGTIEFASVQNRTHVLRAGPAGFEDGTPNYLAAAAIPAGFALVDALGMERVHRHVTRLNTLLLDGVRNLLHSNGRALAVVYGPMDTCSRGATVAFNVLDREGSVIPFASVEAEARVARISIRGGCFCNPGAAERALGIRADDVSRCLDRARSEGFAQARCAECMKGRPLGALRASLGAPSNEADVHRLIELIAGWRDRRAE